MVLVEKSGVAYHDGQAPADVSIRIITDHLRSITFMIAVALCRAMREELRSSTFTEKGGKTWKNFRHSGIFPDRAVKQSD